MNAEFVIKARDIAISGLGWPAHNIKSHYYRAYHHFRFKRRAEKEGLLCQECGGMGGATEPILDDGSGPWEQCGWCEGTGFVTRWRRGEWLRYKKDIKNYGGATR